MADAAATANTSKESAGVDGRGADPAGGGDELKSHLFLVHFSA